MHSWLDYYQMETRSVVKQNLCWSIPFWLLHVSSINSFFLVLLSLYPFSFRGVVMVESLLDIPNDRQQSYKQSHRLVSVVPASWVSYKRAHYQTLLPYSHSLTTSLFTNNPLLSQVYPFPPPIPKELLFPSLFLHHFPSPSLSLSPYNNLASNSTSSCLITTKSTFVLTQVQQFSPLKTLPSPRNFTTPRIFFRVFWLFVFSLTNHQQNLFD